jgi:hypothetical protein
MSIDSRDSLEARIAVVSECRELFGKHRARELWRDLGLPVVRAVPASRPDTARLAEFIRNCVEPATAHISFRSIRAAHRSWCEREGVPLTTECALALALTAHGYVKYKAAGRMTYGARLRAPASPAPPP